MGGAVGSMRPFPPGPPPDRFHWDTGEQYPYNQNFELGQMGWFGPNQEAYVTDLFQRLFAGMTPAPPAAG